MAALHPDKMVQLQDLLSKPKKAAQVDTLAQHLHAQHTARERARGGASVQPAAPLAGDAAAKQTEHHQQGQDALSDTAVLHVYDHIPRLYKF